MNSTKRVDGNIQVMVAVEENMVKGIDVSNHQGHIDWDAVRNAGYEFAFIKATEGTGFVDPWFGRNWHEAKRVGMYRGAYHFPRPFDNADARVEADHFYNVVMDQGVEEGDMLVLDMEVTEPSDYGDYGSWALYWMQVTQSYFEFPPLIYTAKNYINVLNLTLTELGNYGLWLAQWVLNPQAANPNNIPSAPRPWSIIAFWQYSARGSVPGVSGDCDLNLFNGTADRIPLYGKPKIQQEPQPPQIDIAAIEAHLDVLDSHVDRMHVDLDAIQNETQEIRTLLRGSE